MSDNQYILNISELYGYDDEDLSGSAYPIRYHNIANAQKTDAELKQKLVTHKDNTLDTFHGGDQNYCLICRNRKICLPAALQKKTANWYHQMLCHPVKTQQSKPSVNILTGKALSQQSEACVRNAQHAKEQKQLIRNTLGHAICRPHWSIYDPSKKENPLKLWCLTMINPAIVWFEMAQIRNKTAE